jgi:hypothetical protein
MSREPSARRTGKPTPRWRELDTRRLARIILDAAQPVEAPLGRIVLTEHELSFGTVRPIAQLSDLTFTGGPNGPPPVASDG